MTAPTPDATTPDATTTDAPADTAPSAPPVPEPVWSEFTREITVQAYKVHDGGERVITMDGLSDVGPDNYIVNDGGFISIIDAASFEKLYPVEETTAPPKK